MSIKPKMTLVAEPFQVENSLPVVVCVPISTGFSQKAISFIIQRL
jgi:mRNA-degrading endonuclease toxin of MazEF toxin-antitoxin module